ncbi:glycosyltransferase family protein [Vibrio sp. RC27]
MKIFYIQQASIIDWYLEKFEFINIDRPYSDLMSKLTEYGFASLFGIDQNSVFISVANSKILQLKWASEQGLKYDYKNWQKEIIAAQLEYYQPDVIYTGNYFFLNNNMKKFLPRSKLYALWNASPITKNIDLSHFDLGLSFNSTYHNYLRNLGVKNLEFNSFYINPNIKNNLEKMYLPQDIDIVFAGRYSPMFKDRNKIIHDVYNEFNNIYNIQYYLLVEKRVRGLIPMIPCRLWKAYNSPVFLENLFKVFNRSKIVLNTHSNITGKYKGNMRVYEALGSGSFMLSDDGIYPRHLEVGTDFVTYKNTKDMVEKIDYYLKNDKEREEIALNGYNKISRHYTTKIGSHNLENIFRKYL